MSEEANLDDFIEAKEEEVGNKTQKDLFDMIKIPVDWEIEKINKFVEEFTGGANLSKSDFTKSGITVLPKKAINEGRIATVGDENRQFCSEETADDNQSNIIDNKYLITTLRDLNADAPNIGRIVKIDPDSGYPDGERYLLAQGVHGIKTSTSICDEYLLELSHTGWFRRYMKRISVGSTQIHIRNSDFLDVEIPVPTLQEQRKIATVLETIDRAIEKTTEIIDRTERVRKGVTQDIFTRGYYKHSDYSNVRLGPVKTSAPNSWSIKKIPDYFDIIDGDRGKNYPSGSDFSNQGYCLFLSAANVTEEGLKFDETEFITQKKDEELRKGKLKRGDIIMTTRGTVGNFGLYDESVGYDNIRINSGMVILRPKEGISSVEYYYHLFGSGIFRRQINATSYGTAQPQTSVTDIKKMGVLEPGKDEKEQISELINDLVSKIQIQKEYRNQLQSMKRGLMQDLLSGKVRTTDTNIQVPDEAAQYG